MDEPDVAVDEWIWDFGTIEQKQTIKHKFTLKNRGKADLIISDVRSTCACIAVLSIPKQSHIKPGKKAEIEISFYSGYRSGRVTKYVYVDVNDPDQPWVKLTVTGVVKPGGWLSQSIERIRKPGCLGCLMTLGSIACVVGWFLILTDLGK
jgi:hypothetical protein